LLEFTDTGEPTTATTTTETTSSSNKVRKYTNIVTVIDENTSQQVLPSLIPDQNQNDNHFDLP